MTPSEIERGAPSGLRGLLGTGGCSLDRMRPSSVSAYTALSRTPPSAEVTVDYVVRFARVLRDSGPGATFEILEREWRGPDRAKSDGVRASKGEAENALTAAGFPAVYIFRPAYLSRAALPRPTFSYRVLRAIYPVFRLLFPNQVIRLMIWRIRWSTPPCATSEPNGRRSCSENRRHPRARHVVIRRATSLAVALLLMQGCTAKTVPASDHFLRLPHRNRGNAPATPRGTRSGSLGIEEPRKGTGPHVSKRSHMRRRQNRCSRGSGCSGSAIQRR
jgi:hypothetical protein